MPEGHTLHRLAGQIGTAFAGKIVESTSPQGRFAAGAARLNGLVLTGAEAWGKHLLVSFDALADVVHVHLGLWGGLTVRSGADHPVVGQVRWRLRTSDATADLRGPSACELLDPVAVGSLLGRLGPDPLRDDAEPDAAWLRISRSRAPIATLLMDQSVVAGVGNVYRAEVLFRNGLDPMLPGNRLAPDQWEAVWSDLVMLMAAGVSSGRIDTVRPEHEPEAMGRPPRRDDHGGEVYVYRRSGQPCWVCGSTVRGDVLAARNLFWCPTCQNAARVAS